MAEVVAGLTEQPLAVNEAVDRVADPGCGAIAVFVGTVRDSAAVAGRQDKPVVRLEYDAHPELARAKLEESAERAAARWNIHKLVALHRTGVCGLGEPTVVIACSAPHRGDALEACRWLIDEIKRTVPIWKREVYSDGSEWVGAEGA